MAETSRVAVVTGAASGMGLGIASELSRLGHRVALLDLNADAVSAAAESLGSDAIGIAVDVADFESVESAIANIRDHFGPVGIAITAAGIAPFTDSLEITPQLWKRVIDVDLTGTFTVVQAVLPDMLAAGWGRVVTISSTAGWTGSPRQVHYSAAKGGVIAMTKALSFEHARAGITFNSVAPGGIDTPMYQVAQAAGDIPPLEMIAGFIPAGRLGSVADVVGACMYFSSEVAGYITGQTIGVNGGTPG